MDTKVNTELYNIMEDPLFSIRKRNVAPIIYPMHWHSFLELEIVVFGLKEHINIICIL